MLTAVSCSPDQLFDLTLQAGIHKLETRSDIYRAAWVIPVEGPPIPNGALAVENGRIAWLGRFTDLKPQASGLKPQVSSLKPQASSLKPLIHDLGDVAILPGLINAHTHLELTAFAGRLDPQPLWSWLDKLLDLIRASDFSTLGPKSVRDGAAASLAAGVTCLADISRTGQNVAVLAEMPMRKVCFLELITGAASLPNDLPTLRRRLVELERYHNPPDLTLGLAPHTPYTVSPADLAATAEIAKSRGLPFTLHFLETAEEAQWFHQQPPAAPSELRRFLAARRLAADPPTAGPIDLLERAGVLAARPLLAHVNYIDDDALNRLANSNAGIVFCPRAHAFFGHPPHRWRDMLTAGANVCLGTDSLASNTSLSILDELRYLHRQTQDAPAQTLLEMATLRSARALGLEDRLGSLQPGKLADFIAVPLTDSARAPILGILESDSSVSGVWINGVEVSYPHNSKL